MARGNHVDIIEGFQICGLLLIIPLIESQSFKYYNKVTLSKNGLVMGHWMTYRDFICHVGRNDRLVNRTNHCLVFRTND